MRRAHHAHDHDAGGHDGLGDLRHLGEQPDAGTALDEHKDVDEEQPAHDGIDPKAPAGEQVGPGGDALHGQGTEQDGHHRVPGDAQGEHGDHGAAGDRVVGRLRRQDALDGAVAILLRVLGGPLALVIGDHGRLRAAGCRARCPPRCR